MNEFGFINLPMVGLAYGPPNQSNEGLIDFLYI